MRIIITIKLIISLITWHIIILVQLSFKTENLFGNLMNLKMYI